MPSRVTLAGAAVALAAAGFLLWPATPRTPPSPAPASAGSASPEQPALLSPQPVPPKPATEPPAGEPEPPTTADEKSGQDDNNDEYARCLRMVRDDASGGNAYADAWEATGGGEPAMHCHALAQVALGHEEIGATMLEKLAGASRSAAPVRALMYKQAVQARLMQGDNQAAYGAATLALALVPRDPDLLIDRSIAAGATGRYLDAIDDLTAALALAPGRADALTLRAAANRHENRLGPARADIEAALAADPEDPDALLERGIIRERDGDRGGAAEDWRRAIDLAPDTPAADLARQNLALLEAGPGR